MDIRKEANKQIDNVTDAASEAGHRGAAEAERLDREAEGDSMSLGDRAASYANEAKNNVQAGIDHAKRDVRNAG